MVSLTYSFHFFALRGYDSEIREEIENLAWIPTADLPKSRKSRLVILRGKLKVP